MVTPSSSNRASRRDKPCASAVLRICHHLVSRTFYFCGPSAGQSWCQKQLLVLNSNVCSYERSYRHIHQRKQTSKSPTHVLDEVQSPQDIRHLFHEDKSVARYVTEDSQCHTGPIPRSESTSHGGEHHHEMSR
ncbi:uncharacterized protein VDAG_09785 [Verticillium dahliae VdLs.17]|uniref:Uncharacterized protein n=1 Tax=Verticillium dahliae (strain VdLs.17 / ATCC MYA-4575 / FGSC 10137) TaxID=498257 RepID=G2XHN1_VERDV|nr:uncharacterized protein VDAG_09785 [Verticillium dahliae VdLs.17]EGY19325.1 hypothetical protein VDAG_09785 [Verticillium dahliae VdLs.17]KAH6704454.1 hypothetical protein EV126DRAFT_191337 [Verticillium dahliae]